jgi:hypothetical protein
MRALPSTRSVARAARGVVPDPSPPTEFGKGGECHRQEKEGREEKGEEESETLNALWNGNPEG